MSFTRTQLPASSARKLTILCYWGIALLISSIVILFPPHNLFSYDVFGYYMYLPLAFKYHDLTIHNYAFVTETLNTYHASETFYQAVKWDNGNWVMRYPLGLSVFYSPFYFIADSIVHFTKYPADGFSRPYQLSVLYGCLLYTLLGLHFIKKILLAFFDDRTSALTLAGIALGTNYFFHTSLHGQGAMSHNLLFSLYAAVIYLTIKWHDTHQLKHMILLGACIALAALCRASEIICALIPLCYGITNRQSFRDKLQLMKGHKGQIIAVSCVILGIGSLQLIYYHYASGHFIINPYGSGNPGEGLELSHPHFLKVLFSFRKGWFIYTPLMVFAVCGFRWLFKKNRQMFTPVLVYFLLNLYVVSSWSCWWFGSCFGIRALIPSYAALCIPLGCAVEQVLSSKLKYVYLFFFMFCISLNLFQSWQMSAGILDSTNMSRAYYTSTFLQTTSPTHEQSRLLLKGKFSSGVDIFTEEDALTHSLAYAKVMTFENSDKGIDLKFLSDRFRHSGRHSLITGNDAIPECSIEVMHRTITNKSYTWIKASVWVYSTYPADSLTAFFSIRMKHKGWIFKPADYKLKVPGFKPNAWNKLEYYYLTPDDLRSTKDLVCICFTNKSNRVVYIDDLMLESFEPIIDKSVF